MIVVIHSPKEAREYKLPEQLQDAVNFRAECEFLYNYALIEFFKEAENDEQPMSQPELPRDQ